MRKWWKWSGLVLLTAIMLWTSGCREEDAYRDRAVQPQMEEKAEAKAQKEVLTFIIEQALEQSEYRVEVRGENFYYRGTLESDRWELTGSTDGEKIILRKDGESMTIQYGDNPPVEVLNEGWGVISPQKHLQFVRDHLEDPFFFVPGQKKETPALALVKIPRKSVENIAEMMLGSGFDGASFIREAVKDIQVSYLIEYDPKQYRLHELTIVLNYKRDDEEMKYESIQFDFEETL